MTATPLFLVFCNAQRHRLLGDRLAQPHLTIDDRHGVILEDHRQPLIGQHFPLVQPADIDRRSDHAMRIVPSQVGLNQVIGHDRRLVRLAARRHKDLRDQFLKRLVRETVGSHFRNPTALAIASQCQRYPRTAPVSSFKGYHDRQGPDKNTFVFQFLARKHCQVVVCKRWVIR